MNRRRWTPDLAIAVALLATVSAMALGLVGGLLAGGHRHGGPSVRLERLAGPVAADPVPAEPVDGAWPRGDADPIGDQIRRSLREAS